MESIYTRNESLFYFIFYFFLECISMSVIVVACLEIFWKEKKEENFDNLFQLMLLRKFILSLFLGTSVLFLNHGMFSQASVHFCRRPVLEVLYRCENWSLSCIAQSSSLYHFWPWNSFAKRLQRSSVVIERTPFHRHYTVVPVN